MEWKENRWSSQHFHCQGTTERMNNKAISLSSDLNLGPLECKVKMLTTTQWKSTELKNLDSLFHIHFFLILYIMVYFSYESMKALIVIKYEPVRTTLSFSIDQMTRIRKKICLP
jgi:hypothetical protein